MFSLWNARHESGRAIEFYGMHMILAMIVFVAGFLVMTIPSRPVGQGVLIWISRLALLPFISILLIGGVVHAKAGGG